MPNGRYRDRPITARRVGELTLVVVSEDEIDNDASFHVSVAALAIRANSRRPPPLRSDVVPALGSGRGDFDA